MNNKGFTLVEGMIAAALLAGLAVAFLSLNKSMTKATSKNQFDSETTLITNEIVQILADPNKCIATFGPAGTKSGLASSVTNINSKFYTVASGNSPAGGYGNASVTIASFAINSTLPNLANHDAVLTITYNNKNILKGNTGNSTVVKKINLYVTVDASNRITACRSLSNANADIWSRGSGSTIYYSGGNVGVGTSSPQTTLEVNGTIRPQAASVGAGCSPLGAQAYDSASGTPLYCNSSAVWTPSGGGFTITTRTASTVAWRWPTAAVNCNADEKVVGGGGTCTGGSGYNFIVSSVPSGNGWSVSCDTPNNQNVQSTVYALCAK